MRRKELRLAGTVSLAVAAVLVLSTCASSSSGTPTTPTAIAVKRFMGTGTLDTTFGGTGAVAVKIDPAEFEYALAVALQSDGKILAAGHSALAGQFAIAVVRHNTDGSLDTLFGSGGSVRTPIPLVTAVGSAIAVQADGKILVAGSTFNAGMTGIALVRYDTNGVLDATFGNQGIVSAPIGPGTPNDLVSLVLQGTSIIVAGATSDGNFVLKRYDSTGTLDPTFGAAATPGTTTTKVGLTATTPAIALHAGGIVLAGGALPFTGPSMNVVLVRYSANGVADATFGGGANGGIVLTSIGSGDSFSNAVVVQPDNKIVVAGHANVNFANNTSDIALIRYKADGTPDGPTGFGNNGVVVTDLGAFENAFSLALQTILTDVKIVVSGNKIVGGITYTALLRYNPDGTLDPGFNGNGFAITAATGPSVVASGNAVAIQTDGKIVVAGYD